MQVKSLFIKDFQQFKDFELDLTYPAGHELAGQPLKKVCIIGQSGTGKTTLLKFLQEMTDIYGAKKSSVLLNNSIFCLQNNKPEINKFKDGSYIELNDFQPQINGFTDRKAFVKITTHAISANSEPNSFTLLDIDFDNITSQLNTIFIPANLNLDFTTIKDIGYIDSFNVIEISTENIRFFWATVVGDIRVYQDKIMTHRNSFAKLATNTNTTSNQLAEEAQKLRIWEESQENPLKKLASQLDPILKYFNQKIKTDVDFQDINFIKLETLQGESIENDILNTGAMQIIITALPFITNVYHNRRIALFDEPERSLYPDIQTKIIDFYTSLAPSSQFFFATHSPLIASCFEPWEIVELKFNEAGKVYREQYYEGENHVDNYRIDPRYLAYDSILKNVFDMSERSNEKRTEGLMRLSMLEKRLEKLNGQNLEEKEKVWKEYEKLAKKLDWKLK